MQQQPEALPSAARASRPEPLLYRVASSRRCGSRGSKWSVVDVGSQRRQAVDGFFQPGGFSDFRNSHPSRGSLDHSKRSVTHHQQYRRGHSEPSIAATRARILGPRPMRPERPDSMHLVVAHPALVALTGQSLCSAWGHADTIGNSSLSSGEPISPLAVDHGTATRPRSHASGESGEPSLLCASASWRLYGFLCVLAVPSEASRSLRSTEGYALPSSASLAVSRTRGFLSSSAFSSALRASAVFVCPSAQAAAARTSSG